MHRLLSLAALLLLSPFAAQAQIVTRTTTTTTQTAPASFPPRAMPGHAGNGQPYCREFHRQLTIGGRQEEGFGTACLQPDGSWQIVNPEDGSGEAAMATPAFPPATRTTVETVEYSEPQPVYATPVYYSVGFNFGHSRDGHYDHRGHDHWDRRGWR